MQTRVYFWIDGAPEDRPGGPWWYKDFESDAWETSEAQAERFIDLLLPGTKYGQISCGDYAVLPQHHPMEIRPPKDIPIHTK